ncbi:MAG: 8-amino-7-oxononanoate synthase [Deltaproteobacteria bacterium]|jgi:glycine C-acetyltransferase/8-amino-7-oxononanoate synthase|nr:8-amino-7-oxononanoate synthase [Deltaproteobacteria bacterium]
MTTWNDELNRLSLEGMRRSLLTIENGQGPEVEIDGQLKLLLCSNNYLGLADHPALVAASIVATRQYGVGSGASRLVSGTLRPHQEFEERLAAFKGTQSALLFNSGYAANTGVLQGLFGPNDLIFSDSLNHASIIDGCKLSKARVLVYPHNDMDCLEALMHQERPTRKGRWVIVTDGVFSMDGDFAVLPKLCELKERFEALLMVDDAHGTGAWGDKGRGLGEHFGCLDKIDLHMGTLGKALGCSGAYLAADRDIIDVLINRSRSFIFSTSLPPSVPASAISAIELVEGSEGHKLRQKLHQNRKVFTKCLIDGGIDILGSPSQIVPIITGEPKPTMLITQRLFQKGIFLQGIRPPTVPAGKCRLRATLMASHLPDELIKAAQQILTVVREVLG